MHYRNGREAKPGDKVIHLPAFGPATAGLIHSLNAGAQTCNARLAATTGSDPYVNLSDCLHADDVAEAFPPPPPQPEAELPKAKPPGPPDPPRGPRPEVG